MVAGVELTYNTNATAIQMANTIFGDGVTVTGATYSGSSYSSAIYSNGDAVAGNVTPGDTGVILSTGSATRFTNNNAGQSNLATNTSVNSGGQNNEAGFNAIAGASTYDASYMDVDFIPTDDTMTMQFVFSSDEYPEYTNSIYNDMVGVWINGSHVPLSITSSGTTINSVNQNNNINLYNDNTSDQFNTEMDGFTVTMTLTIPVNVGVVNSIRIGVADVADSSYDSNLLIAADSVQTELVAEQDYVTMQDSVTKTVNVLDNDINNSGGTLEITHINGVPVTVGQTITLATGQQVKLNADGTFDITTDSDFETSSFTYEVQAVDGSGNVLETDVGFVTVETIPCFVAGTMIDTVDGPRPVETLTCGDLVQTRDVKDALAELMFGEAEVLIAAKDLVNDRSIRPVEGGDVEYVHLMFDRHQVVTSEGLATESFLPGPQTTKSFEAEIVEEITTIFPELDVSTGEGYGPAARPMLKRYEAEALLRGVA